MLRANRRFLIGVLLIFICGCAIRSAVHDFFGLDSDDAYSLSISRLPLPDLLDGLRTFRLDIHPPLHYVALKAWMHIAGDSLLALRQMNILIDVLSGAFLIGAARRLYGLSGGQIAGVLWAVSPALIFSDNLIRMYTLLGLMVSAGVYCLAQSNRARRPLLWGSAAALCGVLACYTHSLGAIALLSFGAIAVLRNRSLKGALLSAIPFAIGAALTLLYFVPLWNYTRNGHKLGVQFSLYDFGSAWDIPGALIDTLLIHRVLMWPIGVLIGCAALSIVFVRRAGLSTSLLWLSVIAFSALAYFGHIFKTFYSAPFASFALLWLSGIMVALRSIRRIAFPIVAIALLLFSVGDLDHTLRDDPMAAVRFIEQHERANELILVTPDWAQTLVSYHYHGHNRVLGIFQGVDQTVDLDSILPFVTKGYSAVWVVHVQNSATDPQQRVDGWFDHHAAPIVKVYPTGMPISYYDLSPLKTQLPADVRPIDARFGDALQLRGVYLPVTGGTAHDARLHPPSNWIVVTLYWQAAAANVTITPRVRLTDSSGRVFGGALTGESPLTLNDTALHQIAYVLNINPDTPRGDYHIEVTALDSAGQLLATTGKDAGAQWVIAGVFTIE